MTPQPPSNEPGPIFGESPAPAGEQDLPGEVWSTVPASATVGSLTPQEVARRKQMLYIAIGGVGLVLVVVAAILLLMAGSQASHLGQLRGDWLATQGELVKPGVQTVVTITDTKLTAGPEEIGTFIIDATAEPKHFDMTMSGGVFKGQTLLGIYTLEGNRLSICLAVPGQDRPKRVDPELGRWFLKLNRKPA